MGQKEVDCETTLSRLTTWLTSVKEGVRADGRGVLSPAWYIVPTCQSTSVSNGPIYTATK